MIMSNKRTLTLLVLLILAFVALAAANVETRTERGFHIVAVEAAKQKQLVYGLQISVGSFACK